jgi:pilus assembly protein Flp/PilA
VKSESGGAAAEYALILAILGAAIGLATLDLGTSVAGAFDTASALIADAGSNNGNGKNHAGGNDKDHAGGNDQDHAGGNDKDHAGGNH